jgi:hypothetical protein
VSATSSDEPVPAGADHGHRHEEACQQVAGGGGGPAHERGRAEQLRQRVEQHERDEEEHERLQEPDEHLLPRAVVGEAVALELRLGEQVRAQLHLRPEVVDAEGDQREEHVDDVNAEERRPGAHEHGAPDSTGRGRRGHGGGGAGRRRRRGRRHGRRRHHRPCEARRRRRRAGVRSTPERVERRLVQRDDDAALRTPVAAQPGEAALRARVGHHALRSRITLPEV